MARDYLTAHEAADRLGVSLATLYAYVSRGKIDSRPGPDGRSRLYRSEDVDHLIERRQAGRGAAQGAAHSLTWGLPVLETRISLIRPHGHYYRGQSAAALARDGATLEQVARLLWDARTTDPFDTPAQPWPVAVRALLRQRDLPVLAAAAAALPLLGASADHPHSVDPDHERRGAAQLLREFAALLGGAATPTARPLHSRLAACWQPSTADAGLPQLLRMALVLCADHELNASAFATRVAASTGASLHAAVGAGLAALSGPKHGGATARAHALQRLAAREKQADTVVLELVHRGEPLAGFGHPLYPEGDPRAALLLDELARHQPRRSAGLRRLADAAERAGGARPSLDFALAAIATVHDWPAERALALFAAGRMAGWLAHALEQRAAGGLIRPRATYAGVMPPREGRVAGTEAINS